MAGEGDERDTISKDDSSDSCAGDECKMTVLVGDGTFLLFDTLSPLLTGAWPSSGPSTDLDTSCEGDVDMLVQVKTQSQ